MQLCELVLPHTLAETSLFDGRRPKMCFLQIPQQATELAVADLLTAVEEVFKAGEEQPLARTFASRWGGAEFALVPFVSQPTSEGRI